RPLMLVRLALVLVLTAIAVPGCADADGVDPYLAPYETAPLTIATSSGEEHAFTVYMALTPEQMRNGLMFVTALPGDAGMLFVHPRPRKLSMWMKNTVLPLDMLFVGPDGEVLNIVENTTPHSLESIRSGKAALAVLELNAGTVARLDLQRGDRLVHPAFGD
ncbi:MAG: DUF192 domain-containing protein, partial [Pseudomonadota bacterium]